MARIAFFLAAILFSLFGLGYLGASTPNRGFIITGAILFLLALINLIPRSKVKATPKQELSGAGVAHIEDLISKGEKMQAIKRYRDLTGSSLSDAKLFVESLAKDNDTELYNLPLNEDLESALRLIKQQSTIEAVREVRALTGLGLRDAKAYVDEL